MRRPRLRQSSGSPRPGRRTCGGGRPSRIDPVDDGQGVGIAVLRGDPVSDARQLGGRPRVESELSRQFGRDLPDSFLTRYRSRSTAVTRAAPSARGLAARRVLRTSRQTPDRSVSFLSCRATLPRGDSASSPPKRRRMDADRIARSECTNHRSRCQHAHRTVAACAGRRSYPPGVHRSSWRSSTK